MKALVLAMVRAWNAQKPERAWAGNYCIKLSKNDDFQKTCSNVNLEHAFKAIKHAPNRFWPQSAKIASKSLLKSGTRRKKLTWCKKVWEYLNCSVARIPGRLLTPKIQQNSILLQKSLNGVCLDSTSAILHFPSSRK